MNLILFASACFGFCTDAYDLQQTYATWCGFEKQVPGADSWIKVVKHKISAFYSFHQRDPNSIPKAPTGMEDAKDNAKFLFGGRWHRWFLRFKRLSCRRRFHQFMTTLLQIKKGCPRAGEDGLFDARLATFKKLTTRVSDPVDELSTFNHSQCVAEVRRTAYEAFHKLRICPRDMMVCRFPSTSANYYTSRKEGGAVRDIYDNIQDIIFNEDLSIIPPFDVLEQRAWDNEAGTFVESRGFVPSDDQNRHFRSTEARIYHQLVDRAMNEPNLVETVALPEALKVRVITKGPPIRGYVLKPLQKLLHGHLRKQAAFSLIGEPVSQQQVREKLGHLDTRKKFLSGDYKEATDGLLSCCSNAAADVIFECCFRDDDWLEHADLKQKLHQLCREALTGHMILKPQKELRGEDAYLPQVNGQLMGSIMSFPILCVVNAAICRKSLEMDASQMTNKRVRLRLNQCEMMINGDDCVFAVTEFGHQVWLGLCRSFGMLPSVGKYYFQAEFLNINSTTYLYIPNETHLYEQVDYINFGILLNQKRSGGKKGPEDVFSKYGAFCDSSKSLLTTVPLELRPFLYDTFVRDFGRLAKKLSLKLPWFVPRRYGGVGLMPYGEHRGNKQDRAICSIISRTGRCMPDNPVKASWRVHSLCNKEMSCVPRVEDSYGYDTFYGILVKYKFLDACARGSFNEIYDPVDAKGCLQRSVRVAERLVRRIKLAGARREDWNFDPWCSDETLLRPNVIESDWSTCLDEPLIGLKCPDAGPLRSPWKR